MKVHTLDLNFRKTPHTIAAYLVVGSRGTVLVDTGPASTLDTLKARLSEHGFEADDIRNVFLTHIHLDHAGGAGWWAQQGAQIYVHPNGARHLIDPSRLLTSAQRIYGDKMDILWGQTLPAPQDRVTTVKDGEELTVDGLKITAIDTPGHAYHHHTFRINHAGFTGDASGIKVPGIPFLMLPSPPPEFDLEAWHITISKLLKEDFATIYPTHFGIVENVREHLEDLTSHLSQAAEFVGDRMKAGANHTQVIADFMVWNRERAFDVGVSEEEFREFKKSHPMSSSVDGLMRYWRKRWEDGPSP